MRCSFKHSLWATQNYIVKMNLMENDEERSKPQMRAEPHIHIAQLYFLYALSLFCLSTHFHTANFQ